MARVTLETGHLGDLRESQSRIDQRRAAHADHGI